MLSADRHDGPGGTVRTAAGARCPDDGPAARWRRAALAAYYVALMLADCLMLTGAARIVLTSLAAVTAAVLLVAATRGAGFRRAWQNLVYLPVLVAVAQVAITAQLHYTTTLLLTLVGVGGAVPARRTAVLAGLLGCAGWAAAVATEQRLRTPELGYYAAQLGMAAMLGVILHEALRRRQRDLRAARDELAVVLERFENLFQASPAGVGIADEHGVFVAVNPAFCDLVGMPADELVGASSHAYVEPGVPIDPAGREMRYVRPDGSVRWAWLTVGRTGVLDRTDTRHWMLIHLHDVTDRHVAERTVRESDRLLAAVSAAARRIRTGEDARGTIIEAVRELAEADSVSLLEPDGTDLVVTGDVGVEVAGTRVPMNGTSMIASVYRDGQPVFLADPDHDPRVSAALLRLVSARSMMWQPVIADGRVVAILVVSWRTRVTSVSDLRARAVALLADETALALEHERLLSRLEQMAYTDTLTGLSNRRAWQSRFAELLAAARADGQPLAVAIADLDHFKRYNDTYGHPAGDDLLITAAAAFRSQLRDGDLIARWGGEEFVIALPGCGDAAAAEILDRLRAATPAAETCSVGYAVWDGAEPSERLLERADNALYAAKSAGRDMVRGAVPVAVAS
ncbi:diguanylate cyclase [Actinoplanes oblitus]|uniref:Diguanylate cyclase n=1 Tax=Actinoplanes oblitus TaxID=3040509 RepID=A0ABY8W889_9ACTN|nr:diguanylate cyclase [Actinoplanes oblitus]WIM93572.1 diguanylate cyclase [Actinoplanes oblitus]